MTTVELLFFHGVWTSDRRSFGQRRRGSDLQDAAGFTDYDHETHVRLFGDSRQIRAARVGLSLDRSAMRKAGLAMPILVAVGLPMRHR